ncbi:4Fe-4S single cluster protein [Anaerobacterium chartisolvens]|uniref:4Fe-4S single cluster protein n=1 Tax=Anaerobacterium chartisolvens TaxID=1297424 RepID=A0A369ANW7_9FIRM|nr:radical SAM protein [Anaerobacterium chartisolvens]RCX09877.1 4Fe-4S single cluster protein [Anaerobacterium chartisolvens]
MYNEKGLRIISLKRTAITITFRCTLKCKLCGVEIPFYNVPPHLSYNDFERIIDRYFQIVDYIDEFEISGGEALMHEDLSKIIEKSMQYKHKFNQLLIFTNGTIIPKTNVWDTLKKHRSKCHFFISDYGHISSKVEELAHLLAENGITYRVKKYYGSDLHCGGWVDFGNFSPTTYDYKKCYYLSSDYCIQIRSGEIHMCGRSYRAMEIGAIEKNKNEYIDLLNDTSNILDLKKKLISMINLKELSVCKLCNGLCKDSPRFTPAEQLE